MPIRIALATSTAPARMETFIRHHVERLDRVELVLTEGSLPTRLGDGRSILPDGSFGRLLVRARAMVTGQDWRQQLRERIAVMLREARIDVVLAEYGDVGSELLPLCQALGIPIVPYFLGVDAYRNDILARYHGHRDLLQGAAAIVAVSKAIKTQLVALGAAPERVVYNSCGADLERFKPCAPGDAPPHFLAVGRFVEKKAPHITIAAFAQVARQRPEARLTFVGDGPLWERCRALVEELGVQDQLALVGRKSPDEIAALLKRSRAFVQHSVVSPTNDREGSPVAIVEAMGSGVPVVSTRHGDITELVGEERGLLCDEGDAEGMAANMLRLVDHPEEAARMGAAARSYVLAEHRVEDRIASLQSILERAAAGRPVQG